MHFWQPTVNELIPQDADDHRIPARPEMAAKFPLDLPAEPASDLDDASLLGSRRHAFAAKLIENVLPDSLDKPARPACARDSHMDIGPLKAVEQYPGHYLPIPLYAHGRVGRAKGEVQALGDEAGNLFPGDDQVTASEVV